MNTILLRFLSVRKSTVGWLLLTLVALLFSVYRVTRGSERGALSDYLQVDAIYAKWQAAEKEEESQFTALEKVLDRRKELHGKFDAKIAQHLLSSGKAGLAESYVNAVLARRDKTPSLFLQFSKTSLLMGKGLYQEALAESKQLREQLINQPASRLRLYNLVRIAHLEERVGNRQGETAAWEELLKQENFALLQQSFRLEGLTLKDYIQHRL